MNTKESRNYNEKTGYGDNEANGIYENEKSITCPIDKNYKCNRLAIGGSTACNNCCMD